MSDEEQSSLLREFKTFRRWYPVVSGVIVVAIFLISLTHFFDNNIATSKDIEKVTKEIQGLRNDIAEIKSGMDNHNMNDTTDKITINNRLTTVEKDVQHIMDRRYVTERWVDGRLQINSVK